MRAIISGRTVRAALVSSVFLAGLSACVSSNYAPVVYHDADPIRPGSTFASAGDPSLEPVPLGEVTTVPLAATVEALPPPSAHVEVASANVTPRLDPNALPERAPLEARVKPYSVDVQPGDTIYSLSRQHAVAKDAIIEANRLQAPYLLKVGQKIAIPGEKTHTVQPGDSLYSIARNNRVEVKSLALMNNLPAPYTIKAGQVLRLPGASEYGTMAAARASETAMGGPLVGIGQQPVPPADKVSPGAKPPGASGNGFMWPAKGRLISSFGPKEGGRRNDGINIAVPDGAPVYAAKDGTVIYTGNELRGYGNLVLVRHANGYVTAYAHSKRLLVARGDKVRKGQHIADAGSSGGVDQAQVHFEIRKDREPIDPMKYLPRA